MAAKRRDVWCRRRAKRQTKKCLLVTAGRVSRCSRGRGSGAAARIRCSRDRKGKKSVDTTLVTRAHKGPRRTSQQDLPVISTGAPPLRAVECCAPTPLQWFHLGRPLLPTRVRELFSRPLFHCDAPTATAALSASYRLGRADEEALSWLFPAVHNGEWFATPLDFRNHYNSVSHQLLCENAPLFPLLPFQSRMDCTTRHHPHVQSMVESEMTVTPVGAVDTATGHFLDNEAGFLQQEQRQRAYFWWFTHIHTAVLQFGLQEWWTQASTMVDSASTVSLQRIGETWCGCRLFQAAVSAAVAQCLASFPVSYWCASQETVEVIMRTLRHVYMCMPEAAAVSHIPDGDIVKFGPTSPIKSVKSLDDEADGAAVLSSVYENHNNNSSGGAGDDPGEVSMLKMCEEQALAALSLHLSAVVVDTAKREIGILPFSAPAASAPHKMMSPLTLPCFPSHTTTDDDNDEAAAGMGEERIMALVLWLYLCDAAAQTHKPTDIQTDRNACIE